MKKFKTVESLSFFCYICCKAISVGDSKVEIQIQRPEKQKGQVRNEKETSIFFLGTGSPRDDLTAQQDINFKVQ